MCTNTKSAVFFCYTVKCMGFEKVKLRLGVCLMWPVLYSHWPGRKMQLGVALAESPASADGKGNKACEGCEGLRLPSPQAVPPFALCSVLLAHCNACYLDVL